ncbi:hypothetical protein ACL9RL_18685 [Plantibacter sp. Mn2098]|uniref:hypothetical protein n=1 Tax=Plantibacter sp. Mn2098 TaxID=3395266 RepID=UPI003BE5F5E2
MGYREWDETAWLDRVGEWSQAHRAVYVAWFSIVTLIMFGLDFSFPVDAVRTWIVLGVLVVAVIVSIVQLVRGARCRTRAADATRQGRA